MKLIKSNVLLDGVDEKKNLLVGFEDDEIKYVGSTKPENNGGELILEGDNVVVTPETSIERRFL